MIHVTVRFGIRRLLALGAALCAALSLAVYAGVRFWSARSAAEAAASTSDVRTASAEDAASSKSRTNRDKPRAARGARPAKADASEGPSLAASQISSVVDELESSGEAPANRLEELTVLFSAWQRNHALPEGTALSGWACFAEGCLCRVRFSQPEAFGELSRRAGMDDPFKGWAERATLIGPEPTAEASEALWLVVPSSNEHG